MDDLKLAGETGTATLPKRALPRHHPLSFRKPLIAAINGAAAGLGLVEAIYCDVRFAVPNAKFTTSFSRRGLIAEYGVAWLLPRIVGTGRALDLLMSARVITGEEARRSGLADFLAGPAGLLDRAVAYARELASFCSPTSMSIIKSQVPEAIDGDFGAAAERADGAMLASFGGAGVREGASSYLQRRPPQFAPWRRLKRYAAIYVVGASMQFESSDRAKAYQTKLLHFMDECVYPAEPVYAGQMAESGRSVPRVDG